MTMLASTFSIVARDRDGLLGVAVTSRVLAVGAYCPHVRERTAAVASQAYLNPYLAYDFLEELPSADSLDQAARTVLDADPAAEWRQFLAIGTEGAPFAFTGSETDPWAGHRIGSDCAAAGNLLVGADTIDAVVDTFESSSEPLPRRLVAALTAGQAAGGDRRGRQSAAVVVNAAETAPYVDLRVDDHANPLDELARLLDLLTPDLDRALLRASSRTPAPISELRARQAHVRAQLEAEGS
jgi:uncharacterized Ntn-hydrolase superfamily protein